jgi:hypothetical protein
MISDKLALQIKLKTTKIIDEINRDIKAVLKTFERLLCLSINLKKAVSKPYVKKTIKKAT